MSRHIHVLAGCAPRPLASYLKALAVLRLVSEQADASARGWWRGDAFHLLTKLSQEDLLSFFLNKWEPSAWVSPWNKGSGFFDDEDKGLTPILQSTALRFQRLREAANEARALLDAMQSAVAEERAIKEESKQIRDKAQREALRASAQYKQRLARVGKVIKRTKEDLLPSCRLTWRGSHATWLRAAVVLNADGAPTFPALLGTGGNDGNLDFANNAYQRLGVLFDLKSPTGTPTADAAAWLRATLFGSVERGGLALAIGQFDPGAAGGVNGSSSGDGGCVSTPWDLPLLLEGAMLFSAAATRRLDSAGGGATSAPFAFHKASGGYGSASIGEDAPRGELWMPLWERPWSLTELSAVLAEGRAQLKRSAARDALDLARSIARLGVTRGIGSFERFAILERNGKSNFAVPVGTWRVTPHPRAMLTDDLDAGDWLSRIRRSATDDRAPASWRSCVQLLETALMSALAHATDTAQWQSLLIALSRVEAQMVRSGAFTAEKQLMPLPRLGGGWLQAVDDGSAEVRLALALGQSAAVWAGGRPRDPVRLHWLPLNERGKFRTAERGLAPDPRLVAPELQPIEQLVALVQRRIIEAQAGAARRLPLVARPGTDAAIADLQALLDGRVDLGRTLDLARAFAALDPSRLAPEHLPRPAPRRDAIDARWAALRLAHLPAFMGFEFAIPTDPAIVRLLAAGDGGAAIELALRRLRGAGLQAPLSAGACPVDFARALAASLAFPISEQTASLLAKSLDRSTHSSKEVLHVV